MCMNFLSACMRVYSTCLKLLGSHNLGIHTFFFLTNKQQTLFIPSWSGTFYVRQVALNTQGSTCLYLPNTQMKDTILFKELIFNYVYVDKMQMLAEARTGHQIQSWSYRQLWATRHVCWEPNSGPLSIRAVFCVVVYAFNSSTQELSVSLRPAWSMQYHPRTAKGMQNPAPPTLQKKKRAVHVLNH